MGTVCGGERLQQHPPPHTLRLGSGEKGSTGSTHRCGSSSARPRLWWVNHSSAGAPGPGTTRQSVFCAIKAGCTWERPRHCCGVAEEKLILILESIPAWAGSANAQRGLVAGACPGSRGHCSLDVGETQPRCSTAPWGPFRVRTPGPAHGPAQEDALVPHPAQKAFGGLSAVPGPLPLLL